MFTSKSDRLCVVFNGQSPFFKAEADLKLVAGESRDRIEETPLGPVRLDHGLLKLHSVNKMNSCLEPLLNPSPDCGTNWPPLSH